MKEFWTKQKNSPPLLSIVAFHADSELFYLRGLQSKQIIGHLFTHLNFRYDQAGNVLLRSAAVHLKQDGRWYSWIYLRSFTRRWCFFSKQIVAMNISLSSRNVMELSRYLTHETTAWKRTKDEKEDVT